MARPGPALADHPAGSTCPGCRAIEARQCRGHRSSQRRAVGMSVSRDRQQLRGELLRSVSRSFYLSLRVLPEPLRDPLSLAYLLARATDTIADTPEPPVALRMEALGQLAAAIQGTAGKETAARLGESFAPGQGNEAERT